ncbi:hypothetical protein M096_4274 [Parabacteroides distasonis str. 3999B T(B) 6]|nr:hypothetical protein M096_4274 [Parabacteroides distasonis str. 3999B T(B) 6]
MFSVFLWRYLFQLLKNPIKMWNIIVPFLFPLETMYIR